MSTPYWERMYLYVTIEYQVASEQDMAFRFHEYSGAIRVSIGSKSSVAVAPSVMKQSMAILIAVPRSGPKASDPPFLAEPT